jgi:magnesium-transporting ATPase (P-type)
MVQIKISNTSVIEEIKTMGNNRKKKMNKERNRLLVFITTLIFANVILSFSVEFLIMKLGRLHALLPSVIIAVILAVITYVIIKNIKIEVTQTKNR